LIFTTSNPQAPLWIAGSHAIKPWENGRNGLLARSGRWVYLYAQDGLYRLDPEKHAHTLVYPLPDARLDRGALVATQDGNLWLIHDDGADRRLLSFSPDGDFKWQRSLQHLPSGDLQLLTQDDHLYLLLPHTTAAGVQADLYALDSDTHTLTHILSSGSRSSYPRGTWALPLDNNTLLLNVAGGPLVAFDPLTAYQRITTP
jgi:hypothetical protein